jgi:hypothetical protein
MPMSPYDGSATPPEPKQAPPKPAWDVRPNEPQYAKLKPACGTKDNQWGAPIDLAAAGDKLAGQSLSINRSEAVSDNPDRYKQHGFRTLK